MKVVSEEVGTAGSTMAVVDSEEGASRPLVDLFKLRLCDVEDN